MSDRKYVKYDSSLEKEQPGEQKKIQEVSDQFNRFQMMNFNEHMHCLRGTHLKTQGCVAGKFIVPELPAHLAQGMFKKPGTYDTIMRYSSLTPKLVPDNVSAPRGLGIKIFGVEGDKLWTNQDGDKHTQDWTLNNYPILELRNPQVTYEIADSLERNWNNLPQFAKEQSERVDADVATFGGGLPRQQMVAMPQYSQSAYRFGDFVFKFGVFPLGEKQKAIENDFIKDDDPINCISQFTRDFHMKYKVTYSFCAQLLENIDEQPIEDIGIEWDSKKYPWQQIATIEFEPQDSWIPEFRTWWDDKITVNSWHGLKEHQPLGSTNRMRRVVYAESRKLRLRVNGLSQNYLEPSSLKEVPNKGNEPPQVDLPLQNAVRTAEVGA